MSQDTTRLGEAWDAIRRRAESINPTLARLLSKRDPGSDDYNAITEALCIVLSLPWNAAPSTSAGGAEFSMLNAADLANEYMGREPLRRWTDYERSLLRNFARWMPRGIREAGLHFAGNSPAAAGGSGATCNDCEAWTTNLPKIDGRLALHVIRSGVPYDGTPFAFCPWCGKARTSSQEPAIHQSDVACFCEGRGCSTCRAAEPAGPTQ